ncbi:hypothetical protein [Pseudomonas sp.]|uniref:hypothetical protein n=1 Tax=Pseudomonas sp. TaxID=306 RepID=UPI003D6DBADD
MKLLEFLRSASPEANRLVIYASIALVIKQFLNIIPAPISGMYEFGLIVEAILASVIASYLFYLLAVHAKEVSDRSIIQPYLDDHFKGIVRECKRNLSSVSQQTGLTLDVATLKLEEIRAAFSMIQGSDQAPIIFGERNGTWIQYLNHYMERTSSHTKRLLVQLPHLKPDEIKDIVNIDECRYFWLLSSVVDMDKLPKYRFNQSLEFFSEELFKYCQHCKKISDRVSSVSV